MYQVNFYHVPQLAMTDYYRLSIPSRSTLTPMPRLLTPWETAIESLPPFVVDLMGIAVLALLVAAVFWLSRKSKNHHRIMLWMKRVLFLMASGILILSRMTYSFVDISTERLFILFIVGGVSAWSMWDARKNI